MESIRPVPTEHGAYDAHLLRACEKPMHDILALRLHERDTRYLNPYEISWYLQPSVERTDLTLTDFSEDFRQRMTATLSGLARTGGVPFTETEVRGAKTLMRHLSHTAVEYGALLHIGGMNVDDYIGQVRESLRMIFPQHGAFIADNMTHPLWKDGEPTQNSLGFHLRKARRNPTLVERKIALWLAGPHPNISGPDGILSGILAQTQPFLLARDDRGMREHFPKMRRELDVMLSGINDFSDEMRGKVVARITEEWNRVVAENTALNALFFSEEHIQSMSQSPDEIIAKYFPPEITREKTRFLEMSPILEALSIRLSLEMEGETAEERAREMDQTFELWEDVIKRHHISLCDHPRLALAFFAVYARYVSLEDCRGYLHAKAAH